ncbi:MAG: TetR/AcrR family transcriptional regulator [Candidatus Delongbacteria bacterium]|nr:TetR/AcrR family transcriptional regulator [Candidatus Delongbacteria bacterium]MBN2833380.1 TetR/AcrR family transcriptional regulator [Candidatus Delongbacteria bacterium]
MSIAERKELEKINLKSKILEEAKNIFKEEGYDKISIRNIASRINYSPTTIYLYFKNKDDLLKTIIREYYEKLRDEINSIIDEKKDPLYTLIKILKAYIYNAIDPNSNYLIVLKNHKLVSVKKSGQSYKGFESLERVIEVCMKKKLLKENDPRLLSQSLWMNNNGIINLLLTEPDYPWVDKDTLINHCVDTFINGLK